MGTFFHRPKVKTNGRKSVVTTSTLHKLGCKGCPLKNQSCETPKMEPAGAEKPLIYVLGDYADKESDARGRHIYGKPATLMKRAIGRDNLSQVRYNNVVRTKPDTRKDLPKEAIEACRRSVEADIAKSKPFAIFGFGDIPLRWIIGESPSGTDFSVHKWRGLRMPVTVGGHSCWYYCFDHPRTLVNKRKVFSNRFGDRVVETDEEQAFKIQVSNAVKDLETLPEAEVVDTTTLSENITTYHGGSDDLDKIKRWFDKYIKNQEPIAIDLETNGLRPYADNAKILTISFGTDEDTIAFALDHKENKWSKKQREELLRITYEFIMQSGTKIAHNLSFELEWLGHFLGREVLFETDWIDTMALYYVYDGRTGNQSLDMTTLKFLGFQLKDYSTVDVAKLDAYPLEDVLVYNGMDVKYTHMLWPMLEDELEYMDIKGDLMMARRIHQERIPALVATQLVGIPTDQQSVHEIQNQLQTVYDEVVSKIAGLEAVIKWEGAKRKSFNPGSPSQVVDLLKEEIGAGPITIQDPKTKKDKVTTGDEVLSKVQHPLASLILEYRKVTKLKGTYVDPLVEGGDNLHDDGMIHTILNHTFTRTGRLSSNSPNIQNFPKRKDKWIRRVVTAPPGYVFVSLDYGQLEARVAAMVSQDPVFARLIRDRYDIHMAWAEKLAYAYPQRVGGKKMLKDAKAMKDFRTDVKNQWTFPLIYNSALRSVSGNTDIPIDTLEPLYNEFWETFAGIKEDQDRTVAAFYEKGYVPMPTGRRRWGPLAHTEIYNTRIQGPGSDIVVDGMQRIAKKSYELDIPDLQPRFNIHDDLSFMFPKKKLDEYSEIVIGEMLRTDSFDFINVPILVEMEVGPSWYDLEPAGEFYSDDWGY